MTATQRHADLTPDIIALGRMLWGRQEDQVALANLLDAGSFTSKATRAMYLLLAGEVESGITPVTVGALVRERIPFAESLFTRLAGSDGTAGWREDSSNEALAEAVASHGRVVKFSRALTSAGAALAGDEGYEGARSQLDRHLTSIDLSALSAKPYDDKADMARRVRDYLDSDHTGGLTFGLARLDARVTPVLPGNLVIIGGRPGTGKSTWLRNWTRHFVEVVGEPTAYFSFEMSGEEKLPLFACMSAGISYQRYVRREFSRYEREKFDDSLNWWVECEHFVLNERSDVTPNSILRTAKRYRAMGITTFVFDHLHRVQYERNGKGDIRLAIAEFVRTLKSWLVDSGSKGFAGSQYTKGSIHEEPGDEMIKESGEIIAEADKIFHTWRPLVAGLRTGDGTFIPTDGGNGRRIFAADAQKGSELGVDPTRAFLMVGKQRVRSGDGALSAPFDPDTGVIADTEMHQ